VTVVRDDNGQFVNTVTATGKIGERTVMDSDPFTITAESRQPAVELAVTPATPRASAGEHAGLTVVVRNTGNVALAGVAVAAPKAPDCDRPPAPLALGGELSYPCSVLITPQFIDEINGVPVYAIRTTATYVDGFDGASDNIAHTAEIIATHLVHLPAIAHSAPPPTLIDLVVDSITVNEREVEVTIKNAGSTTLQGVGYWVDLYIDPSQTPEQVNQLARDWGDDGLVWGVAASAPPLAPGGVLVLRTGDGYYAPGLSTFPDVIPAHSPIYVQVDSASLLTEYGAVLEVHEINGDEYNNIRSITLADDVDTGRWPAAESSAGVIEQRPLDETALR
jgi:hypothetical protein